MGKKFLRTNPVAFSEVNIGFGRLAKPWDLSDKAVTFIAQWENGTGSKVKAGKPLKTYDVIEGMILEAYFDDNGYLTIGCGHQVLPEDNIRHGQKISLERAREFLKKDKANAIGAVNRNVKVPLFQYEFDALASMAYNGGAGAFAKDVAPFVNTGRYDLVPEKFKLWYTNNGRKVALLKRRVSEMNLFKTGVYDATH